MSEKFKLKRVKQCAKCPWRVDVNPHDIPNGYSEEAHARLSCTIAPQDGGLAEYFSGSGLRAMSCHEHPVGQEAHCVGWLANQLGPGNNIALRLRMLNCENIGHLELVGEQHACFEDTSPDEISTAGKRSA